MKGRNHEILNCLVLIPFIYYLGSINADFTASIIFIIMWLLGTFLWTCDRDTKSRSTSRAGFTGKIINKIFKHRRTLHSISLWFSISVLGYYIIGWQSLGLTIPNFIHIITDKIF